MQGTAERSATTTPDAAGVEATQQLVTREPRRERIVVESNVPMLDTGMFDHMTRIAKAMASSGLVPAHLNRVVGTGTNARAIEADEALSNCLLVVNQSVRWKLDPFAVAQHTYVHAGKLGYEGKLIAAVVNTHPDVVGRLTYKFSGEGMQRKVVVSGKLAGDDEVKTVEGTVEAWHTVDKNSRMNASWFKTPDQMLTYRGAREWARRHLPEAILGIYADDELDFEHTGRLTEPGATPPPPPARGAQGLRDALKRDAVDAEVVKNPPADGAVTGSASGPVEASKPLGTDAQRDAFLERMNGCEDQDALELVADETRAFQWLDADKVLLNRTYQQRHDYLTMRGGRP